MNEQNVTTERLTDRAFHRLFTVSVVGIVLSLLAFCSVTWAWYSQNLTVYGNSIKTGTFDAQISVFEIVNATAGEGEPALASAEALVTADASENGVFRYSFAKETLYRVGVDFSGSQGCGYCVIRVSGCEPMFVNLCADDELFEFFVLLTDPATVSFETRWGTYSGKSAVLEGETLSVAVTGGQSLPQAGLPTVDAPVSGGETGAGADRETAVETEAETETETETETEGETDLESTQNQ